MNEYSIQNKKAWEYNAYDFWAKEAGMPADRAQKIVADSIGTLKRYANYFETYKGIRVANICGFCGKKAVPLVVLGADVTVFDISEDNTLKEFDCCATRLRCTVHKAEFVNDGVLKGTGASGVFHKGKGVMIYM